MDRALLPLTKLVLATSAIVQIVLGLVGIFGPVLVRAVFWPEPFEPPDVLLGLRYHGVLYITMGGGAIYALWRDAWSYASTYLAIAGPYVALSIIVSMVAALTPPGAPAILWLYVGAALVYVPLVAFVWVTESRQGIRLAASAATS